jgi:hypothetical protein
MPPLSGLGRSLYRNEVYKMEEHAFFKDSVFTQYQIIVIFKP